MLPGGAGGGGGSSHQPDPLPPHQQAPHPQAQPPPTDTGQKSLGNSLLGLLDRLRQLMRNFESASCRWGSSGGKESFNSPPSPRPPSLPPPFGRVRVGTHVAFQANIVLYRIHL